MPTDAMLILACFLLVNCARLTLSVHVLVLYICLLMLVFILSYLFMSLCYSKCLLVALLLTEASITDTCGASDALLCLVLDLFDQQMLVARLQG